MVTSRKFCIQCGKDKPSTRIFFTREALNEDGLSDTCKVCFHLNFTNAKRERPGKPFELSTYGDGNSA